MADIDRQQPGDEIPPTVIPTRHGFLAVSEHGARFAIGVVGDTEAEALDQYARAVEMRHAILARRKGGV